MFVQIDGGKTIINLNQIVLIECLEDIAKHGKVVERKSGRTNAGLRPATPAMSTIA